MEQTLRNTPAYQTLRRKTAELLSGDRRRVLIAIDGRCGSGKTTLASLLAEEFGGALFHMDDFYLREEQRTPERLAETGGNVDYERFRSEVLKPLSSGEDVLLRRFSCSTFTLEPPVRVPAARLCVIEGSYSLHPYFGDSYDLRVFLTVPPEVQAQRILKRNGEEGLARFKALWIPKEEAYFQKFRTAENALILSGLS